MLKFTLKQFLKEASRIKSEYGEDARYRLRIHRAGMDAVELHSPDLPDLEPGEYTVELFARGEKDKDWTRVFSGQVTRPMHGNSAAAKNGKNGGGAAALSPFPDPTEQTVLNRAFTYMEKMEHKLDEAQKIRDNAATASMKMMMESMQGTFRTMFEDLQRGHERSLTLIREDMDEMRRSYERRIDRLHEEHDHDLKRQSDRLSTENQTPGERMFYRGLDLGGEVLRNLGTIREILSGQGLAAAQGAPAGIPAGQEPV